MKSDELFPSIGVIIPVYNSEKWLRACLDSVVDQTVQFSEIIIVNDGSTDKSGVIAEEYSSKYDRVKLINQDNFGAGKARNVGMDCIRTDYYLFLDSDDYLNERTVETLKGIVSETPLDVVYFNGKSFLDEGADEKLYKDDCRRRNSLTQNIVTGRELFAQSYPTSYFPSPCFNLVNREYVNRWKIRFYEDRSFFEDNSFAFFVMDRANKVKYIPDVFYMRRYREGSTMTSAMCVRKLQDLSEEYSVICRYIKDHLEICKNIVCVMMLQNFMLEVINFIHANLYEEDFKSVNGVLAFLKEYRCLRMLVDADECINQGLFIKEKKIVGELKGLLDNDYNEYHLFDVDGNHEKNLIDEFFKRVLKGFHFDVPQKRIGIYGAGKHTEGILNLYNRYYGTPLAQLFIIQTIKDRDVFMGYPVIPIDEMSNYSLDRIAISSFRFHDEMKTTLTETATSAVIVDIYDTFISDVFADYQVVFE